MESVTVTLLGKEKLESRLKAMGNMKTAMDRTMNGIAIKLAAHVQREKLAGQVLHKRTGRLARSVTPRVGHTAGGVEAIVGTNVEYAKINEYGGVIRPVNARFLAIPLPAALTPAGVLRKPSARDFGDTFIKKGIIFQKSGKGIAPLFVLKRSVTIPERSYLRSSLREMKSEILATLAGGIREAMK